MSEPSGQERVNRVRGLLVAADASGRSVLVSPSEARDLLAHIDALTERLRETERELAEAHAALREWVKDHDGELQAAHRSPTLRCACRRCKHTRALLPPPASGAQE